MAVAVSVALVTPAAVSTAPAAPATPLAFATPSVLSTVSATLSVTPALDKQPSQGRHWLAEPFVGAESELPTADQPAPATTDAADKTIRTSPTTVTLTTGKLASGNIQQSTPSTNRDLSSSAGSNQPSSMEPTVAPGVSRQEELFAGSSIIRSAESTLSFANSVLTQASASPSTPARTEAPTAPALSSTLLEIPEALDLRQNNWGRVLGHQLNWLIHNRMQEAEIKVNPPELGPLTIRMSLHQHQMNVTILCHEAAVREAIENALPRLREMLDSQGSSLNPTQVFDQSSARQQANSGEQSPQHQRDSRAPLAATQQDQERPAQAAAQRTRSSLPGRVDDYA